MIAITVITIAVLVVAANIIYYKNKAKDRDSNRKLKTIYTPPPPPKSKKIIVCQLILDQIREHEIIGHTDTTNDMWELLSKKAKENKK